MTGCCSDRTVYSLKFTGLLCWPLSVVAVLFSPPTLIASIYGMNFRIMPELDVAWGYPLALVLMVAAAFVTWFVFKWKKWL